MVISFDAPPSGVMHSAVIDGVQEIVQYRINEDDCLVRFNKEINGKKETYTDNIRSLVSIAEMQECVSDCRVKAIEYFNSIEKDGAKAL